MADRQEPSGLRGSVRRAVGEALDATVGRVSHTVGEVAVDVTGATAHQVIEELEPYLIDEAIPRIVDGVTPHLVEQVVPEVIDGVTPYLVEQVVPRVVDGVQGHLVEVTVPQVVEGMTPRLADVLIPQILERLRPYLEEGLVPPIVDALMPRIEQQVAPQLVDALLPKIRDEVAPGLLDALMPRIEQQVAPQLVDALLPKIRDEVVPTILDDIVENPGFRDLIREQSQGLLLDALESARENLADVDNLVERLGRRLLRRKPRPQPESEIALVLDASRGSGPVAIRRTIDELAAQRDSWARMPMPPAPPGREYAYGGAVTWLLGLAIDLGVASWLISQGLAALVNLLNSILNEVPRWLTIGLTAIASSLVPLYLAACWWLVGRTLGSWLIGTRVCTPDGRNPGLWRSLIRAWVMVIGLVVWLFGTVFSLTDARRRSLLDMVMRTEVRYVVPMDQQNRYVRNAVVAVRDGASDAGAGSGPTSPPAAGSH